MYQQIQEQTEQSNQSNYGLANLSLRAQRRLLMHIDTQGELALEDAIRIQRVMVVGNRAIAAYTAIAQTAAAAAQAAPYESERIDALVVHAHQRLCSILDEGRGY